MTEINNSTEESFKAYFHQRLRKMIGEIENDLAVNRLNKQAAVDSEAIDQYCSAQFLTVAWFNQRKLGKQHFLAR